MGVVLTDYERVSTDGRPLRVSPYNRWRQKSGSREKVNAAIRRYSKTAKGRATGAARDAKRRQKISAAPLTIEERERLVEIYAAARRLTVETGIPHHVDHVQPLAQGGRHHPDNLQILPAVDNIRKGAKWNP
jgi:hypothetical protein